MLHDSPRTALITGAGRRIGRAIALDLAGHGWSVAIHYRTRPEEAEAVAAEARSMGVRAVTVAADLTRDEDVSTLLERTSEGLGPVGCLINNAAAFAPDRLETATRASWDLHLETNLRAPFVLIQRFLAQLPADATGNVVNLLDAWVGNPTANFVSYGVSKAALGSLTRPLALALAPRVRVNAIAPGLALRGTRQSEAHFARQWSSTPLLRGATPEEIAAAVRFILDSPSMTGQRIALDGGADLRWV